MKEETDTEAAVQRASVQMDWSERKKGIMGEARVFHLSNCKDFFEMGKVWGEAASPEN